MTQPYTLTAVDNPHEALETIRQLNRGVQRNSLTPELMDAAIATIDSSVGKRPAHSLGLSWIVLNMPEFVASFDTTACRALFERHLDNPYINRVIEDDRLFGLLAPTDQEAFMRAVVERCPLLDAQWIITASARGIFMPTVLELIFERLKGDAFTSAQIRAFATSFLVGSCTDPEGLFDTWSPFIGARNEGESLEQALKLCAMHCPELFFSTEHDLLLEQRFANQNIGDDDLVKLYDTAVRHLTTESLARVSTEVLEKHGYVTGIPTFTTVRNQSTGDPERAYILKCMLAGIPTTFLQEAPHGYLDPKQPVFVYFRQPAVTRRSDIGMYVAEFILLRVNNAAS